MDGRWVFWIVTVLATVQANDELPLDTNLTVFDTCFHADPELCLTPPANVTRTCECSAHPSVAASLVCCNVTDIEKAMACAPIATDGTNVSHWQHIHILNATLDALDISKNHFKRLQSLAITDGRIKAIVNEFTRFSEPRCLNFSNNNLTDINVRAFTHLVQLQVLDISANNLSTIPNVSGRNMTNIDIRGNQKMLCKSVLESIDRFKFVDLDSTFCLTNNSFNWFNSTDSIPLRQLESMKQIQAECPAMCDCKSERMNFEDIGSPVVFTAKVDCSSKGLVALPERLPSNTIELNVSNNSITSLSALNNNPWYRNLLRLYADDNEISSMLELEGTAFLEDFNKLSLKRNKLKSIPIYLLSNTLDRNPSGRLLFLQGNRLNCDCNSAKVLRLWLLSRQTHIKDIDGILCDNNLPKVVDLSELKLCQSRPHDWADYIYFLIAVEIILLLLLILKVSYDYWIFKTSGYLPWPASKMPKLPCEYWLCET